MLRLCGTLGSQKIARRSDGTDKIFLGPFIVCQKDVAYFAVLPFSYQSLYRFAKMQAFISPNCRNFPAM